MLSHLQTHTYEIKNTLGHNSLSLDGSNALQFSTKLAPKSAKTKRGQREAFKFCMPRPAPLMRASEHRSPPTRHRITQH